jgi:hypothetical protein
MDIGSLTLKLDGNRLGLGTGSKGLQKNRGKPSQFSFSRAHFTNVDSVAIVILNIITRLLPLLLLLPPTLLAPLTGTPPFLRPLGHVARLVIPSLVPTYLRRLPPYT